MLGYAVANPTYELTTVRTPLLSVGTSDKVVRYLSRLILCMIIFSYSSVANSYISGKFDTMLETDQTAYYSRSYIEEQAEINWRNNKNNKSAGFQADIRYEEIDSLEHTNSQIELQINQLFFAHKTADINYTVGRFNRSDLLLGFYALDGIEIKTSWQNWLAGFHAGKPRQMEDYNIIDAGKIYGIDLNHHVNHLNHSLIQKLNSRIGWQQLYQQQLKQNYIHLGLSGSGEPTFNKSSHNKSNLYYLNQVKIFFNGSYLIEKKSAESINAGVEFVSDDVGLARLVYASWKPQQPELTFKQRFYSVYANGKQTTLQADFFHNHKFNQQYYVSGRKVWREFGNNGYGVTAGFDYKSTAKKSPDWQLQLDSLVLKNDLIHSLYLGFNQSISATLRANLNSALQYKKYASLKDNAAIALQAGMQQMIKSDLFLDFNARYIYNHNLKNEYRISFRLSYRFDDGSLGRL
jgi:hypothetical protein